MRVFVTGTGRCGTTTFFYAASHATNYSVGDETATRRKSPFDPFAYPDWHIEVSPFLASFTTVLSARYPDARWIHISRNRETCVESLAAATWEFMDAISGTFMLTKPGKDWRAWGRYRRLIAAAYYDQVERALATTLPNALHVRLEEMLGSDWKRCWDYMQCDGDFEKSISEWRTKRNSSGYRGARPQKPLRKPLKRPVPQTRKHRKAMFEEMRKTGRQASR